MSRLSVWIMFFFETFFTILLTIAAWSMFGDGWGDVSILLQLNWSCGVLSLLSGVREYRPAPIRFNQFFNYETGIVSFRPSPKLLRMAHLASH